MNLIYGLTGGIGMGKSAATRLLAEAGLLVVDSDDLAREIAQPDQQALEEIRAAFGDGVMRDDGRLDRSKMAECVFSDNTARKTLEAIIHPRVREKWLATVAEWRAANQNGVVVIPLLFEVGAEEHFDNVLCIACTADTQRARLRERGWNDKEIDQRVAAQMPVEEKMSCADQVIWNEGSLDMLRAQLIRVGCVE